MAFGSKGWGPVFPLISFLLLTLSVRGLYPEEAEVLYSEHIPGSPDITEQWRSYCLDMGCKTKFNPVTGGTPSLIYGRIAAVEDEGGVWDFLGDETLFGEGGEDLRFTLENVSSTAGAHYFSFRQSFRGAPIEGSGLIVKLVHGEIRLITGRFHLPHDLYVAGEFSPMAKGFPGRALSRLGLVPIREPKVDRIYLVEGMHLIPCLRVEFHTKGYAWFLLLLDGRDGGVISLRDIGRTAAGRGSVYLTNPLRGEPVEVELENLDDSGAPSGTWAAAYHRDLSQAYSAENYFVYSPDEPEFDQSNVYYHVDRMHDFVSGDLGFRGMDEQVAAVVLLTDADYPGMQDNAGYFGRYLDGRHTIGFGAGRYYNDYSKESAVIYHEYTHAVTQTIVELGYMGEPAGLDEGYSDYFGCTLSGIPYIGEWVSAEIAPYLFRDLTGDKHYPEDLTGESHYDGEIWAQTGWEIREEIGSDAADALFHESRFTLLSDASMVDGAVGLLSSEESSFGNLHLIPIIEIMDRRGFLEYIAPSENIPPVADAGEDREVRTCEEATLAGNGEDPDGEIVAYYWELVEEPEGAGIIVEEPGMKDLSLFPVDEGEYIFSLRVADDGYAVSESDEVAVISSGKCEDVILPGFPPGTPGGCRCSTPGVFEGVPVPPSPPLLLLVSILLSITLYTTKGWISRARG